MSCSVGILKRRRDDCYNQGWSQKTFLEEAKVRKILLEGPNLRFY
jgi:hypothetical protein